MCQTKTRFLLFLSALAVLAELTGCAAPAQLAKQDALTVAWPVASTTKLGGYEVTPLGEPKVVKDGSGEMMCFDGKDDALLAQINPVDSQTAFTVEILFKPDADGGGKQQFLHMEDADKNRVMVETRLLSDGKWYLHTFIKSGTEDMVLATADILHSSGEWHWVALTYQDGKINSYVDGEQQLSNDFQLEPLKSGVMSIGSRTNQEHWFKGCIKEVRFANAALGSDKLQKM